MCTELHREVTGVYRFVQRGCAQEVDSLFLRQLHGFKHGMHGSAIIDNTGWGDRILKQLGSKV